MAISVLHNPSDNKLCRLLQAFFRRPAEGVRVLSGGAGDLFGPLGGFFLRLAQEGLPALRGLGPGPLEEGQAVFLRAGDDLPRLRFRGRPALPDFAFDLAYLLDCF